MRCVQTRKQQSCSCPPWQQVALFVCHNTLPGVEQFAVLLCALHMLQVERVDFALNKSRADAAYANALKDMLHERAD